MKKIKEIKKISNIIGKKWENEIANHIFYDSDTETFKWKYSILDLCKKTGATVIEKWSDISLVHYAIISKNNNSITITF